ncbi:unnamed protein product [Echinostoma caproni]|uniref:Uncharacterized protein n=1 Tax=Echinostoma caproni TaxID=27848 RepID=A0A183A4H4_9TREM|nr:unnamed protein product [Echinostoma caproni]
MLQDWISCSPVLKLSDQDLVVVDYYSYVGSCVTNDGSAAKEITARISKARAAYAELKHFWRRRDVSLKLKGRVYCATVRAVLLYGCETLSLRLDNIRRLEVFDYRCLRSSAHVG